MNKIFKFGVCIYVYGEKDYLITLSFGQKHHPRNKHFKYFQLKLKSLKSFHIKKLQYEENMKEL